MMTFIRDMIIGWIIYTENGKKIANQLVNKTYKMINKTISSTQSKNTSLNTVKNNFEKGLKNDDQ